MLKSGLVATLVATRGLSQADAETLVQTVVQAMVTALCAGENIELRGFGSFRVKLYPSYQGRNPRTGLPTTVKQKRGVHFRTGKELRARVNAGLQTGGGGSSSAEAADKVHENKPVDP